MKNKIYFFTCLFFLIFTYLHKADAQTDSGWQSIYLTPGGGNTMDGVEAYFQLATCNNEDIIYVKFINHNTYPVKLQWYDAVFTQELKWVKKEQPDDEKSLTLNPNAELKGECSSTLYPELQIKVKNFVADKKDFKRFSASQFVVFTVQ